MKTSITLAAFALLGCLAAAPLARADDDTFEVDFYNTATFSVTVYMDGGAVCSLGAGDSCTRDFPISGGSYSVHFLASTGSTSDDTVAASSCEDGDIATFTVSNEHVHFSCEDPIL